MNPFPAPIPAPNLAAPLLARPVGPVYSFLTDYSPPQIHQWNFTLERQLPAQLVGQSRFMWVLTALVSTGIEI